MIKITVQWDITNSEDNTREVLTTIEAPNAEEGADMLNSAEANTRLASDERATRTYITISIDDEEEIALSDLVDSDDALHAEWGYGSWDGVTFTNEQFQEFINAYERLV